MARYLVIEHALSVPQTRVNEETKQHHCQRVDVALRTPGLDIGEHLWWCVSGCALQRLVVGVVQDLGASKVCNVGLVCAIEL